MKKQKFLRKIIAAVAVLFFLFSLYLPYYSFSNLLIKPVSADTATDSYTDTTKINTGSSSNYQVTGGQVKLSALPDATGGTITTSGGYTIHTFTSSGTFTPSIAGNVETLVVGGGGGGGGWTGNGNGGGGAGGYLEGTMSVTVQGYPVTVGNGGNGGTNASGSNGTSSVFNGATAVGGGGGGGGSNAVAGVNGGSGGGGGPNSSTAGSATQANSGGLISYKNAGGVPSAGGYGGGGGGAGGVGGGGTTGLGGIGKASSISGSSVTYAAGGVGGLASGTFGTTNRGNGGDSKFAGNPGGTGGSGIVIIRYLTIPYVTSGIIQSINLLSGISLVSLIQSFAYVLSSLPAGTGATIQFSQNGSTWYDSAGNAGTSSTLSQGSNTISLSALNWSGANFYYKISITGTGASTPTFDDITLNYLAITAPTNCALTALGDNAAHIVWGDNTSIEDNYLLERSVDGGSYSLLQTLAANTVNYDDNTVTNGTYTYKVRAISSGGYSSYCVTNSFPFPPQVMRTQGVQFQGIQFR